MHIDSTPEYLASQQISPSFEARFWDKVFIMTEGKGCWLWLGSLRKGYGALRAGGKGSPQLPAQRASWIIHRGPIPNGFWVLHECDNPRCVRIDHLFVGTAKDNSQDMMRKGRMNNGNGETSRNHKLTWEIVGQIRDEYRWELRNASRIALKFGIAARTVRNIANRNTWR